MAPEDRNYVLRQWFIVSYEPIRSLCLNRKRAAIGKRDFTAPGGANPAKALSDLQNTGYHQFPDLVPENVVNSIIRQLDGLYCSDSYRAPNDWFLLEDAPRDAQLAAYKLSDLVRISEVMDLANDPALLWLAQEYLGCTPTIANLSVWWSFPGRQAEYAQLYHRDYDDLKFLKVFVYLSEVTPDDGPHVYISRSVADKRFRRPRRHGDSLMESSFSADQFLRVTGVKGTMFIEDTFGLHKGTPPRNNRRLVFQVLYTVLPVPIKGHVPQPINQREGGVSTFDPYVNRLLIA